MLMERAQTSSTNVKSMFLMSGKRKHAQHAMNRNALALFCSLMERWVSCGLDIAKVESLREDVNAAEGPK